MTRAIVSLLVLAAAAALPACGGGGTDPDPAASANAAVEADAPPAARPVARIVFIDQEEACDCTRARIDASWTALQQAIEGREALPVERLHGDTQETEARPYLEMKPMMVAPALYLLDADGALVQQLQGELTESQIAAAL